MTSFEIGRREQVRASPRANGDRLLRLFEANHQFFGRRHAGDRPERSEDASRERAAADAVGERDQGNEEADQRAGQRGENDGDCLRDAVNEAPAPRRYERSEKGGEGQPDQRSGNGDGDALLCLANGRPFRRMRGAMTARVLLVAVTPCAQRLT